MSRDIRTRQKYLREENKRYGRRLIDIPESQWDYAAAYKPYEVWRSCDYLVQVFPLKDGAMRMSICRTMLGDDGRWLDGIPWEELMRIKEECGYGKDWAVEVMPPADEVVNVANMRHLWLLPNAPPFAWRAYVREDARTAAQDGPMRRSNE